MMEDFQISGFGIGTLLAVLVGMGLLYIVVSYRYAKFQKRRIQDANSAKEEKEVSLLPEDGGSAAGQVKLLGVDEKTAAMIMAIVSDESGIPLSELQFVSIRALEES